MEGFTGIAYGRIWGFGVRMTEVQTKQKVAELETGYRCLGKLALGFLPWVLNMGGPYSGPAVSTLDTGLSVVGVTLVGFPGSGVSPRFTGVGGLLGKWAGFGIYGFRV